MIRVLVVDDDFMVARVHSGFVDRTPGFAAIGTAHTGADTIAAVERLHPDLVLLDVYLPDMTGLAVLQRLRANTGTDVDVIVVTAARDAESVKRALQGGVVQYLIKPFRYQDLRDRLEQYAERRRQLAALATGVRNGNRQDQIDRVFPPSAARRGTDTMPKGLNSHTAELVREALRAAGDDGLSAAECAQRTGLSRVSARRYLEHMVRTKVARVRSRYGSPGRPQHRFQWTG
jgi:response regulator of citrate/malate metabolism